jgi:hypothetical protein
MDVNIWNMNYSPLLFKAGVDIVIGDFNLPGSMDPGGGWIDFSTSKLEKGTTYNESSSDFGVAKWDKVLLRKTSGIPIGNLMDLDTIVPECRAISDHVGIALVVAQQSGGPSIGLSEFLLIVFLGLMFLGTILAMSPGGSRGSQGGTN